MVANAGAHAALAAALPPVPGADCVPARLPAAARVHRHGGVEGRHVSVRSGGGAARLGAGAGGRWGGGGDAIARSRGRPLKGPSMRRDKLL